MSIEVKGLKELDQALKKLESEIANKGNSQALFKASTVARNAAIEKAPQRSGNLKSNIVRKRIKDGLFIEAVAVYIKPAAFYARFIELGAVPHRLVKPGDAVKINGNIIVGPIQHPGISPTPFLRPALDENINQIIDVYASTLWRFIKRHAN